MGDGDLDNPDTEYTTVLQGISMDLRKACEEAEPALRQLLALEAVNIHLIANIGVPEELLAPIREMFSDIMNAFLKRKHGGAVRSLEKISQLARAAAGVTVLNKDYDVGVRDAVRDIAKRHGLKRDTLQEFYDDLHRPSRTIPYARFLYDIYCRNIRSEIEWEASPSAAATRRLFDYIDKMQKHRGSK